MKQEVWIFHELRSGLACPGPALNRTVLSTAHPSAMKTGNRQKIHDSRQWKKRLNLSGNASANSFKNPVNP
ncbi:MAG: hypothetical protein GY950_03615 [bacterium]|nr:hypothetical protein [bacterium]